MSGLTCIKANRAGIDTYQQPVVYMRSDCDVCRAEGFQSQAQVEVLAGASHLLAILHHVTDDWLRHDEIALSEAAWTLLGAASGDELEVRHPPLQDSLAHLRAKVHGVKFDYGALRPLMEDVSLGRLADIHLASFAVSWNVREAVSCGAALPASVPPTTCSYVWSAR